MIGMACMTSCASDPDLDPSVTGEEMAFEAWEAGASRTAVTTNSNLKSASFSLFGNVNRTGEYYPGLKLLFDARKVTFNNNNKKWDYGTPQLYWLMGQEHSFVAMHPDAGSIPGLSDLKYSDSKVSFSYTVPTINNIIDYRLVMDMLVATHRRMYTLDSAGAIKFGFRHILSRINITPALDEVLMYPDDPEHPENKAEYITFRRFEIYGLKTKASFSFTPSPLPNGKYLTDDKIETYEVFDNSVADAVLTFTYPKRVTNNNTYVNICENDDALLVLPQTIGKDAKIILYYTVNDDHTDDSLIRTVTFPLSDLPIDKWESGKSYTYMFTIEKAYTGQIRAGSLKWTLTDLNDNAANDRWINDDGIILQDFDLADGK